MADLTPTVEQVKKLLGSYSIASIRNWLKQKDLVHTANTRDALAERVRSLISKGELTVDEVKQGMIGIEESSSKRTFLYRISKTKTSLDKIDQQLMALKIKLSSERTQSSSPSETTKIVYVMNGPKALRAKWNEMHIRLTAVRKTRDWVESKIPKIVVLVVDKASGVVQLRCDAPEDEHPHLDDYNSPSEAYYSYFKQQAENMLGLSMESLELRSSLEAILKKTPRIVRTSYSIDESADGGYTKRTQKQKHKDVRDLADWQDMLKNKITRTFEEAPLHWLHEMSKNQLTRDVFSYIDATNGLVRFDAHCYEEEIDYVIGQLV
jgi:hypothetical protein